MNTYRKGIKESNIDHALLFANKGELDSIGHSVLSEIFSDHLPLLSTFKSDIQDQAKEARHRIRWDRLKNPILENLYAARLNKMCTLIPEIISHYDKYISAAIHTGVWTLGI